ncbi:unnamed protein product [Hydatigera taeniaeformis]|uniref:Carbonyl reductase [NADPH] 1 n=1 Tax=Hydatigena taeniaeformis TaxID=6205 RepID=A0A3P7H8E3_HYDTA|nr:unnamed protein product [Hydatigera taeniaeformis]
MSLNIPVLLSCSLQVTGANKGIGNGIVELLARGLKPTSEWHVYLTARNEKLGLEAVKVLEEKGLSVKFHQLDITDAESRHRLAAFIKENYAEGIDILVNNAGIAYKVDSTAPFGEQAKVTIFLPLMAKDSRLVNVASTMAIMSLHAEAGDHEKAGFSNSAYGMSKVGLWKATAILAEQFRGDPRHILINSCCPGYVNTDMSSHKGHKTILEGTFALKWPLNVIIVIDRYSNLQLAKVKVSVELFASHSTKLNYRRIILLMLIPRVLLGADTPVYLATLPKGATEPYGQFVRERCVVDVDKECPL